MRHPPLPIAWFYNEMQQIGVDFDDPVVAARYDAAQRVDVEGDSAAAAEWGIGAGHLVIEFGPGTGSFAVAAALRGARVIAVDISAAMLERARRRADDRAVGSQIEFRQGGFLTYDHREEAADFVVTEFALHHLPDFWKAVALGRIFAMLKPGGKLVLRDVVFSFPPERYVEEIEAWIDRVCGDGNNGWSRAEFETHARDEYSTFTWILEGLLQRAGFIVDRSEFSSPTYALYVCSKPANVA